MDILKINKNSVLVSLKGIGPIVYFYKHKNFVKIPHQWIFQVCWNYRASPILRAATDCCRSRLWLAGLPTSGSAYWRSSQTLTVISVQFLSPISSNVSSVRTWRRRLTFLFFTEPACLNILACLLIVLGLGTGRLGNCTRNLRRVSEQGFLFFIYLLWIYTLSHNENSCLGMSQIAIITIT